MKKWLLGIVAAFLFSTAARADNLPVCNWGDMIYRGSTGYTCVPYDNTPGKFLQGQGSSAAPVWTFQASQSFLLPTQSTNTFLGNVTGGTASPSPVTASQILDKADFASLSPQAADNTVLYRGVGSLGWKFLPPGTAGSVLTTGGNINPPYWAPGGSGTVTSIAFTAPAELTVTGSPVTGAGTVGMTWASQSGNLFFASPNGGSGTPAFRAVVAADIASAIPAASDILDTIGTTRGSLLYRGASGWAILVPSTAGRLLTTNGAGADPSWGTVAGNVSSVGLAMPSIFTVTNSPITTNGTLTATLNTQAANLVFSGPTTGAAATPAFRAIVGADLPNPAASTLGGVQSKAAVASNFLTQISTSGVVSAAQPACADLSNAAASCATDATNASNLSSGTVAAARMPALTGDVTTSAGAVATTITTNAVTDAKFRQSGALSIVGRSANSTGNTADISASAASDCAYRESGSTLGCGTLATAAHANSSITYAKIQNISATQRVLGRNTAGAGVTEEATASQVLDWVSATQGQILYRDASAWVALNPGTAGQVLQSGGAAANPSWLTVTGSGTVTSVSGSGGSTGLTLTGGPITGSGTLTLGGTLAVASGGTNLASYTQGDLLYASGATTIAKLAKSASASQFLSNTGATNNPAWAQPAESDLSFTDITTNNVTSTKHGFAPKSGADATTFLNGAATPAYAAVKDSDLSTTDITTNNASTSKHGFLKKLSNVATEFMDGTGNFSVPGGGGIYNISIQERTLSQATTKYMGFGTAESSTETDVQYPVASAGTMKGIAIKTLSNIGGSSQTLVATVRKNAADTTITCTISSGASTCNDTAHTSTYVAGDLYDVKFVLSATTGSAFPHTMLSGQ